ncbi:MAG: hypothetical protein HUU38_21740, partial [Anaerolineales bacterium]|nr:hypothetical protein [Anaerolineales bacterium]
MKKGQKNFLPQKHGLRFVNRFDVADLIDLTVFENWTKTHPIIYGLCGGMCFAALDMFYENAPAPADTT